MQSQVKLRFGIIGFGLTFFLLVQFLAQFPSFVERYYSNGLYPILTLIMSNFSGQFNFSVTEFVLWFTVLVGIPLVIGRIRKRRHPWWRILLNLVTTAAIVYVWFYLFWGLNYFREPLKSKLELDTVQLPIDAFDSTFVQIIRRCNDLSFAYSIQQMPEINAKIDSAYDLVFEELQLEQIPGYKGLKTFAANWMLNKTTTSGWFSPWFHEVQYNTDLMIFELPYIIAHEKAHQKGYTSEAEANFLAYLVCLRTADPLCQYSGHFQVLMHFLAHVRGHDEKRDYYRSRLNRGVQFNLAEVRERWRSHQGLVSEWSRRGYDLYLKSNSIEEGLANYSLVVDYIVRYHAQTDIQVGRK